MRDFGIYMPVFLEGVQELRDAIAIAGVGEYLPDESGIFEGHRVAMESSRLAAS